MIKWLLNKFKKKKAKDVFIWGIIEGPIRAEDIPDSPYETPAVMMIMKFSHGDTVSHGEFWFDSMDDAYEIVKHFHHTIEPIKMDGKDFEVVR